jgi:tRNA-2-methylthio-N6-dimethylallyladenosine synthase
MKYFIQTFGCQMNEAESEQIAAIYEAHGWKEAKTWQEADEVVINSCSVRESAENRVFGLVNNINKLKIKNWKLKINNSQLKGKKPRIILAGCMVGSALGERKRYSPKQLKKRLPQVDEFKPWWKWGFEKITPFRTRKDQKKAFVPIMKGCNHFCAYCVVPYAKGKEISYPLKQIVCQVEELAKRGWEEVVLLGQNVNSYKPNFSRLLRELHQIKGIKKISFVTSNPWDLTDEIIKAMKLPKIDRYLHLPLQSGDNRILKKMNRPYTTRQYLSLVKKIRKAIPGIKIGTDIIVGFPGETKQAFENTVNLCQKISFAKAYIAIYSPRPGTAAFSLKDNIPRQEKKRRWRVLEELITTAASRIGRNFDQEAPSRRMRGRAVS